MSDTDEDAFASADEGDVSTSIDKSKPTIQKPDQSGDRSEKLNVQSDAKKNIDQSEGAISKTSDQSQGKKSSPKSDSAASQSKGKKGRNKKSKNKKGKGNDASEKEHEKEENKHEPESETKSPRSDNLDTITCENAESVKEDIKDNKITVSTTTTDSNPTDKTDNSEDKTEKDNLKDDDGKEDTENKSSEPQELLSPQKEEIPRDTTPTRKIQRRSVKEDGGDIEHSAKEEDILERLSGAATSVDTTHTDAEENVLDKLSGAANAKEKSGGWGWGWGGSILSTAATSVSTFTNNLEEGFSTVLETVESSLGVPDPDEIARIQKAKNESPVNEDSNGAVSSTSDADEENEEEEDVVAKQPEKAPPVEEDKSKEAAAKPEKEENDDWFGSWGLSSINKVVEKTVSTVEKTGKTLVSGSIDVLETVGKKTYDVVTKPDPGLKKTRQMLDGGDKPNLSSMLRQAKDENEKRSKMEEEDAEARQAHYGTLFDEYKGLVHLEALEMLSNQCEVKVQSLLGALPQDKLSTLKPDLIAIKEAFEIEDLEDDDEDMDEHDFEQTLSEHFSELHIDGVSPSKLINVQKKIRDGLEGCSQSEEAVNKDCKEIHKVGIQSLAELTARSVEQFKKIGELALLHKDNVTNFTVRAKTIANVTRVLCTEVGILSVKFSQTLNTAANKSDNPDSVNPLITNIYLEATNSSTYIQDAFQLFLPILQQATLEKE